MSSRILIVEDDTQLKEALVATLDGVGYEVESASNGLAALDIVAATAPDLVVTDVQMQPMGGNELLTELNERHPGLPVLMMTAYGTIEQAVGAMRDGAVDYLVKPFDAELLRQRVARYLRPESTTADGPVVVDIRSKRLMALAARAAESDVTVLLTGESGTGKEVVARYSHVTSSRSVRPFVAINCAAIPEQMLEALLFGYDKGAFTGADAAKDGKFVQANGGTLLLDEISEMDLGLQAKLLRVLQEKEVDPLGAKAPVRLDVRVLATSNRDLQRAVSEGRFREDLFYRLNVFPLEIPPLRERPEDILPLAESFISVNWTRPGPPPALSDAGRAALKSAGWPGNVRQLQNVIQRALVLVSGSALLPEHLALGPLKSPLRPVDSGLLSDQLWEEESRRILTVLEESGGNRGLAAEQLGISPRTLRYKLAKIRESGLVPVPA
jgi:two-component system response regulator FlrC